MLGFQSTRLVTEGALEPFFFLYTDDSIQGNPETCKQSSIILNYEVKNKLRSIRIEFITVKKRNQMPGQERMKVSIHLIGNKKHSLIQSPFNNADQFEIAVGSIGFLCHIKRVERYVSLCVLHFVNCIYISKKNYFL